MTRPTLRTIARLLAPWWIIHLLCARNRKLRRSNDRLSDMVFLACSRNVTAARRLRHCPTHGQQPPNAWGCPECVRELLAELATAREALRRLQHWGGYFSKGFDCDIARGVRSWLEGGMTGPLPPLPQWLVERESKASSGERY